VQSEVASKVAAVLRIQLAERESRSLSRPPTTNPQAYDLYLRARVRRPPEFDQAIAELSQAIAMDSTFAAAWAERASFQTTAVFNFDAAATRLDRADADIQRALALDSTLALAWEARATLVWNAVRGWHFSQALHDVRHSLALRPSSVAAHNTLGALYFHYGFLDEARRELDASLSLDPRDGCDNPTHCTGFSRPRVARVQAYKQQFDSAYASYRAMTYVDGFAWEEAVVLNALGRPEEGLALLDSAEGVGAGDREAVRGLLFATLGRRSEALQHIAAAVAHPVSQSHFHHAQFTIACAYARLGDKAQAVEWLRRTADNGMPNYPLFRNDPNLKGLQGDPGYEVLMTRLRQQFEEYGRLVHAGAE
jgi:tetratricopeptide (TPR) repeat protein